MSICFITIISANYMKLPVSFTIILKNKVGTKKYLYKFGFIENSIKVTIKVRKMSHLKASNDKQI